MPLMEWGGGWLEHGEFDKSGVWHFDKDRIRHELEIGLRENELCPVLNRNRILETLDRLPHTINPKTDPNWTYCTSYQDVNGKLKEVATGIKPVLKKANKLVMGEFKPSWEEGGAYSDKPASEVKFDNSQKRKTYQKSSSSKRRRNSSKSNIKDITIGIIVLIVLILIFG